MERILNEESEIIFLIIFSHTDHVVSEINSDNFTEPNFFEHTMGEIITLFPFWSSFDRLKKKYNA